MPRYETAIPTDLLPPLEPFEIRSLPNGRATFDEAIWADAGELGAASLSGEVVIESGGRLDRAGRRSKRRRRQARPAATPS